MPGDYPTPYIGIVPILSFGFSVIAAVLAIDMYRLLRTGQSGNAWRVLIIASVMFALMQTLHFADLFNFVPLAGTHLSEIVELVFVMSLAYAFHLQRSSFAVAARYRQSAEHLTETEDSDVEAARNGGAWRREEVADEESRDLYTPLIPGIHDDDEIEWDDAEGEASPRRR